MSPFTRRHALRGALAAGVAGVAAFSTARIASGAQARQSAFAAAAEEFGVPEPVLLAVSYLKSRWDYNGGNPSTSAGFGPMHLTDLRHLASGGCHHDKSKEDPRGDTARARLRPTPPVTPRPSSHLQTIDLAAELTGVTPEKLRTDPDQNIRGGAAVLAEYQRRLTSNNASPADWYAAIARYSGASDEAGAAFFADEVFKTMAAGVSRTTDDGQRINLVPQPQLSPNRGQLRVLKLAQSSPGGVEAPPDVSAEWIPAPYAELEDGGYGNYDKANRPSSQKITHIVIHDTEATYDSAIGLAQDPTYLGWHYTIRSTDGHIAQHIRTKDIGWHAGNWYLNATSIGVEHEGFAAEGSWYTETMYRASAKLVRYLAERFDIPLDRDHILGHDNIPGPTTDDVAGMHWDPGPYWDWAHYFELLGAPLTKTASETETGLVVIAPNYGATKTGFTGCDSENPGAACPAHGSSAVHLHTEPRADSPLLPDPGLRPDGSPSTVDISDIGSRVSAGQRFAVVEVRGDWTAIWFQGQKGWFHNPNNSVARPANGQVVVAKSGKDSVAVYGRAYPEAAAYPDGVPAEDVVELQQYVLDRGQRYAAGPVLPSEYYHATTFDGSDHVVVRGKTKYVQIQFGHRIAYVKLDDVDLVSA